MDKAETFSEFDQF